VRSLRRWRLSKSTCASCPRLGRPFKQRRLLGGAVAFRAKGIEQAQHRPNGLVGDDETVALAVWAITLRNREVGHRGLMSPADLTKPHRRAQ
jgi:hypothetical protein